MLADPGAARARMYVGGVLACLNAQKPTLHKVSWSKRAIHTRKKHTQHKHFAHYVGSGEPGQLLGNAATQAAGTVS